jgi:hypothetical protein
MPHFRQALNLGPTIHFSIFKPHLFKASIQIKKLNVIGPAYAKKTGGHTLINVWFVKVWLRKVKRNVSRQKIFRDRFMKGDRAMKKTKFFQVVVISVMVASVLLVGCSEAAFIPGVDVSETTLKAKFYGPDELMAYRWNAMAQFYADQGLLNFHSNPDDLLAYRWQAMAEFYQENGLLAHRMASEDLTAYRWNAMAMFYAEHGLLNEYTNPDDLLAYRWHAMAEFYQRNGLPNYKLAYSD